MNLLCPPARRAVVAALCCAAAPLAQAQLLDEVETRRDGDDAIVVVRFVTPVRYLRSVAPRANDLTQVFYEVIDPRGVAGLLIAGQRKLAGGEGLPAIAITDEFDGQAATAKRKLVVRFGSETRFKVRAGRGNRSIEIVLEGQGTAVKPRVAAPPMPPAAPGRQFVVLLSSSTDPGLQLQAPVPAALQEYQIVTSRRVADGRTLYEVSLGYFGNEAEATRAAGLLKARFPQAAVVALNNPAATPVAPPATGTASSPPAGAAASAPVPTAVPGGADFDAQGSDLLARARAATSAGDHAGAIETLNKLLNLPPNRATREGQELIGRARLQVGDKPRARAEFETFLRLYPQGADSDRVRALLAALPAAPAVEVSPGRTLASTTTSGSVGLTYYGGKSKLRSQDFQDSPVSGLPEPVGEPTLSNDKQKQAVGYTDLNWRQRDADQDMRFVFRDTYTANLIANKPDRNRLSALYFDYKSMLRGTQVRLGRQSPNGAGVLSRFDGVSAGYTFAPRWRANLVAGIPTDKLTVSGKRRFWGASVDAEALTSHFGANLYTMHQMLDGVAERRAVGSDWRYFEGGASVFGTLDYDLLYKALNTAMVQGNWLLADGSSWSFLYDRRRQPMLMLSNMFTYATPTCGSGSAQPGSLRELINNWSGCGGLEALRNGVKDITATSTQANLTYNTPIAAHWQAGGNLGLTNIGKIDPIPEIEALKNGQAATGNQWSLGGQLIGNNLYSARDTHVYNLAYITSQLIKAVQFTYNNVTGLGELWTIEPSLQVYAQRSSAGLKERRYKPGLRLGYRPTLQVSVESGLDYEITRSDASNNASRGTNVFYYFGGRYDF